MISQIKNCRRCNLCFNQEPLLDKRQESQVFWVGLSAKKTLSDYEMPLSPNTNSGMVIKKIEEKIDGISTYKTNLVKCLPLNSQQKLRYPNKQEIDSCIINLQDEIRDISPNIVFLLGEKVSSSVSKYLNIKFDKWNKFNYYYEKHEGSYYIPIHHPSYIYVYKRKLIEQYTTNIEQLIRRLL